MLLYILFRIIVFLFKITPFPILYLHSEIISVILYRVVGYRKKVIVSNLKNSFPNKNEEEIRAITKSYYKNLSDILLESIKGYTLSKKKLLRRFKIINQNIEHELYSEHKNMIFVGGHLGNWEWGTRATPYLLEHQSVILYKPISNKYINRYVNNLRKKDKTKMVSITQTARAFMNNTRAAAVIMLSDQNTTNVKRAYWFNFLNQKTSFLHGLELYAKRNDLPVVFFSITRCRRGHYEIHFTPITLTPKQLPKGQLTKLYAIELEKAIKLHPEQWLWSHKRWKNKFDEQKYQLIH